MTKSYANKVDKTGLCLGCGMCEAIYGKDDCKMALGADGFFHPQFSDRNEKSEKLINEICPSINVVNHQKLKPRERVWGKIVNSYQGHSTNEALRLKSSSGGVISALAIYLLESGRVDAVLHVGGDSDDFERNVLKKSVNREEVLNNTSSRYAPALIFDRIFEILESSTETFCFIGKPCDIAGLNNFLASFPQHRHRFKLTISIFCAGMPSFNGTKKIIEQFEHTAPVRDLAYRGNGWPGNFTFTDKTGKQFYRTYAESWGKVLNRHLAFRCKICPEGIGMLADIAVGDAWETETGYPDFSDKAGLSLILSRTDAGQQVIDSAVRDAAISCEKIDRDQIKLMQPYQYRRRQYAGIRIAAYSIVKKVTFNFRGLNLVLNIPLRKPKTILREFYGTFKRARASA